MAIFAQVAEVYDTVEGDIDFFGQMLTIHPNAVVKGDIRVQGAQVVQVRGKVEGTITGSYSVLDRPASPAAPQTAPDKPDAGGVRPEEDGDNP